MKKLLLLDANVIIDLHALGLFEKIAKTYDVHVTRTVFREARLSIDPGELESIAYLSNTEEETEFCTCDKAAITLIFVYGAGKKIDQRGTNCEICRVQQGAYIASAF